jgi:hypothetical protein
MNLNLQKSIYFSFLFILVIYGCGTAPATAGSPSAAQPAAGAVEATQTPQDIQAPQTTQPAVIVHTSTPGAGGTQQANAHDNEESLNFQDKDVESGDQFKINRFERPFTSKDMDYIPYVDIRNMDIKSDESWYYIDIELVGLGDGNDLPLGSYGAEFDLNMDGRAEYLILARPPFSEDWSTDGVSLFFDQNGDIGGARMFPDESYNGNGYETVLVDSAVGVDPDLVWAHFVNSDKPLVGLAIKRTLFDNANKFLWNVLAAAAPIDPTKMYFNDTMTLKRAGSPRKQLKNLYPVNELAGFDNTCRIPYGFVATGSEPMGCSVAEEDPLDVEFGPPAPPTYPTAISTIPNPK